MFHIKYSAGLQKYISLKYIHTQTQSFICIYVYIFYMKCIYFSMKLFSSSKRLYILNLRYWFPEDITS